MAVADIVFTIFHVLLDWLDVAIMLVFIYMLFRLFSGGKGLGNLFKGGEGDNNRGDGNGNNRNIRNNRDDKTPLHTPEEDETKRKKGDGTAPSQEEQDLARRAPGLDVRNPAAIRIRVVTSDGHPIRGAELAIWSVDMPRWRRALGRRTPEFPLFKKQFTDRNGWWPPQPQGDEHPQPLEIGSGFLHIAVKSSHGKANRVAPVAPFQVTQGVQDIIIPIGRGEDDQHHNPTDLSVKQQGNDIVLRGMIE